MYEKQLNAAGKHRNIAAGIHRGTAAGSHRGRPRLAKTMRFSRATLAASVGISGVMLWGLGSATAAGNTWYVAPNGSDSASGGQSSPLATVNAAVAKATSGDIIYLRGGTYHQQVTMSKDGLQLLGFPGETVQFDGTSAVSGWRQSGSTWIKDGWTTEFDRSPTYTFGAADGTEAGWGFVNPSYPTAAWPDQVFVDGTPLKQVTSASQVVTGTFYVDYAADQLVVGSDPTGRAVRASTLNKAMSIRGANTVLRGFSVYGYAPSVPHMGTITLERPGIKVEDVNVTQNATTGISAIADNIMLTDVVANNNGLMGIHASGAYGLTLDGVRANGNNTERFNQAPSAGGMKVHKSRNVTIRNSEFVGNLATGLWFDQSNYNMNLVNNTIKSNSGHGIFLEISDTAVVAGNVIAGNGGHGLQVDNTGHVKIWNNTFMGNARPLNIVQDDRDAADLTFPGYDPRQPKPDPTVPWVTVDVTLANNLVSKPSSSGNCLLCVEDYTHQRNATQMQIRPNGNLYRRTSTSAPTWAVVWSSGAGNPYVYTDLPAFKSASGQEASGQLVTTDIVDAEGRPSATTTQLTGSVAQALPADVAALAGQPAGTKVMGAWSLAGSGTTPPPPNQAPTAAFGSTASKLTASFDASTSSDPDGTVTSYSWNFGDGTTGTGRTVSRTYSATGTYSVTLTVTDDDGASSQVTKTVAVIGNVAPTASFTSSVSNLTLSTMATASDSDGTIAGYTWSWGDGTTSTGQNASHTYANNGTYAVELTVKDNDGATAKVSRNVTVTAPLPPPSSPDLLTDLFERSVSPGWGTADFGGVWTWSGSSRNTASVSGGVGQLNMGKSGSGPSVYSTVLSGLDRDLTVQVGLNKIPVGGSGVDQGIVIRRVAGEGDYRARLRFLPNRTLRLGLVRTSSGGPTPLTAEAVLQGITYGAGQLVNVRVQATGQGSTTLKAKVWAVNTAEPSAWAVMATDSTPALQQPGSVGFHSYLSASASNPPITARFDGLKVRAL